MSALLNAPLVLPARLVTVYTHGRWVGRSLCGRDSAVTLDDGGHGSEPCALLVPIWRGDDRFQTARVWT